MTIESTPEQHKQIKDEYRRLIQERINHPLVRAVQVAEHIFPQESVEKR